MKLLFQWVLLLVLCVSSFSTLAITTNSPVIYDRGKNSLKITNEIFSEGGTSFTIQDDNVEIVIDQKKLLAAIPTYKRMRFINRDLTQAQINIHKVGLAGLLGWRNAAMILADIYENTNADQLNIRAYLLAPDNKGISQEYLLFTFHFTRNLYNQMNWKHAGMIDIGLTHKKIAKVSSDFHFSDWYLNEVFKKELPRDS